MMNRNKKKIYTDHKNYQFEILSPNLLHIKYLDECEVDLDKAKELVRLGNSIMAPPKYFIIANMENMFGAFDADAKKFIANSPEVTNRRAGLAIVLNSLPIRILVRGFTLIHKKNCPIKIFKSEREAIIWMGTLGADIEGLENKYPEVA